MTTTTDGIDQVSETGLREIVAREPQNTAAALTLGVMLGMQGRYVESTQVLLEAVRQCPSVPELHYNLGLSLQNGGDWPNALMCYQNTAKLDPQNVQALLNAGVIHQALGEVDMALGAYAAAISARPDCKEAHNNRAVCLLAKGDTDAALGAADAAIAIDQDYANALCTRGTALQTARRYEEALASYDRAIELEPNNPGLHSNRGNCLDAMDRLEEALSAYQTSLKLAPNRAEAHNDVAVCLSQLCRYSEALDEYGAALRLKPDYAEVHFHAAMLNLLTGNLKRGWEEYEWRFRVPGFPESYLQHNQWDGIVRRGTSVLVRSEQGFGDTIQFIRLVPALRQAGIQLVIECQPGMKQLVSSVSEFDGLTEREAGNEPAKTPDLPQVPLMSLPRHFGIELTNIPCDIPYVHANAAKVDYWRDRIARTAGDAVKVGICWAGRPTHKKDYRRSVPLARFASLAAVEGVTFYGLQRGKAAEQAADSPEGMVFDDLGPELLDFSDTAAAIEVLDLVISVDTSVTHLAGALGKPIWNLLASDPDWRWLLERTDSPWYPTMRLFRQPSRGNWDKVFEAVASELEQFRKSPISWQIADAERQHAAGARVTAKAALLELIRRNPGHGAGLNTLGALSWIDGDVETAVSAFTTALQIDPDDAVAAANCADAMIAIGRGDVALKVCNEFLSRHPDDVELTSVLAKAQVGLARAA